MSEFSLNRRKFVESCHARVNGENSNSEGVERVGYGERVPPPPTGLINCTPLHRKFLEFYPEEAKF